MSEQKLTLEELIAKAQAVIDAYDLAWKEDYDECRWQKFCDLDAIEDLRELLAKHTPTESPK